MVEHDGAFCYRKVSTDTVNERNASSTSGPERVARGRTGRLADPTVRAAGDIRSPAARPGSTAAPAATIPEAPPSEYATCLEAFRAGDLAGAEKALDALIRACPTFVPGHLLLGGVYVHRDRYDDATVMAERVLLLDDLEPRAHLLLGMIAARSGRVDEALRSFRRTLYLDDSLALAHFCLGNLFRERGDRAKAIREYENVVRDWERHTFELTEAFAADLTAEQLVECCRVALSQLQSGE